MWSLALRCLALRNWPAISIVRELEGALRCPESHHGLPDRQKRFHGSVERCFYKTAPSCAEDVRRRFGNDYAHGRGDGKEAAEEGLTVARRDFWRAEGQAAEVLAKRKICALPIDPFGIAAGEGIACEKLKGSGVSGCLCGAGNVFSIFYNDSIASDGF